MYSRRVASFQTPFQTKQPANSPSFTEGLSRNKSMFLQHVGWFRSPISKLPLQLKDDRLVSETGEIYAIENGIPLLSTNSDSVTANKKDFPKIVSDVRNTMRKWFGTPVKTNVCNQIISNTAMETGSEILVIGLTEGSSLRFLPANANCWGITEKLDHAIVCKENLEKWDRKAQILVADPGHIPFAEAIFDLVWLKNNVQEDQLKCKPIQEAIRVCKPGGKMILSIQSSEITRTDLSTTMIQSALGMIPPGASEVAVTDDFETGSICLHFRKPLHFIPENRMN